MGLDFATLRELNSSADATKEPIAFMKLHKSNPITRRRFLYGTGAGVALFNILPGSLLRGAEHLSPNDKLNVAGIGIGSRGGADVDEVAGLA